jgi:hypothetical protein
LIWRCDLKSGGRSELIKKISEGALEASYLTLSPEASRQLLYALGEASSVLRYVVRSGSDEKSLDDRIDNRRHDDDRRQRGPRIGQDHRYRGNHGA